MADGWGEARKLTRDEARMEQHLYWSRKSVAERLAAMTALTRRLLRMWAIDLDDDGGDVDEEVAPAVGGVMGRVYVKHAGS